MASRKKIKVTSPCVADRYAGADERIVEFTGTRCGFLLSVREDDAGNLTVEVYRADEGVTVRGATAPVPQLATN